MSSNWSAAVASVSSASLTDCALASQQSARLDRPAAVDADADVGRIERDRPRPPALQHVRRLEHGELPGIARTRDEHGLGRLHPHIDVLERVPEQHQVADDVGRAPAFLNGIGLH